MKLMDLKQGQEALVATETMKDGELKLMPIAVVQVKWVRDNRIRCSDDRTYDTTGWAVRGVGAGRLWSVSEEQLNEAKRNLAEEKVKTEAKKQDADAERRERAAAREAERIAAMIAGRTKYANEITMAMTLQPGLELIRLVSETHGPVTLVAGCKPCSIWINDYSETTSGWRVDVAAWYREPDYGESMRPHLFGTYEVLEWEDAVGSVIASAKF